MKHYAKRVLCEECGWVGPESAMLDAPNPFAPETDRVTGCPNCRAVESLKRACWHGRCKRAGSSGTATTDGGYAWHCWEHPPKNAGRWPDEKRLSQNVTSSLTKE